MTLRIKLIQRLISINEAIFFYPKLRRFYNKLAVAERVSIIDVGANKGQSIRFFQKMYPKVRIDAFEPNKRLYMQLCDKFRSDFGINIHNSGISNFEGNLLFHENVMDETSTFETLDHNSRYLQKKAKLLGVSTQDLVAAQYDVQVIPLAKFFETYQGIADILKIDVEGHELKCLEGLFSYPGKVPVRYIQIESHNDDMYIAATAGETAALLEKNGFKKIYRIKHGFGDFYEIIFENEIQQ